MAKENQVEPQQITKEPQQVTKEPQGEAAKAQQVFLYLANLKVRQILPRLKLITLFKRFHVSS